MKICAKCKLNKPYIEFSKGNQSKDGYKSNCKKCRNESYLKNYRTVKGKIGFIYSKQKIKSKGRGHPSPKYSKEEFYNWCINNEKFIELFKQWKESGFEKDLAPSIDRIKDELPYSFENIQVITWKENNEKGYKTRIKRTKSEQNF